MAPLVSLLAAEGRIVSKVCVTAQHLHGKIPEIEMDVVFTEELYQTLLAALENSRIDALACWKNISLACPNIGRYPMEPQREFYNFIALLFGLTIVGILKLLVCIALEHVD